MFFKLDFNRFIENVNKNKLSKNEIRIKYQYMQK